MRVTINPPKNQNSNIPVCFLFTKVSFFLGIKMQFFFPGQSWVRLTSGRKVTLVTEKPLPLHLVLLAFVSLAHVDLIWPR